MEKKDCKILIIDDEAELSKVLGDILKNDGYTDIEYADNLKKGREKIDKTNSLKWRIYSALWTTLLPMRRYLLAFYSRIWIRLFGPI